MLKLTVVLEEDFDVSTNEFGVAKSFELELEHSLFSLAKWESRECKPFLGKQEKTTDEVLRYVRDMILTPDVPEMVFSKLSDQNLEDINTYINAAMTATTFREVENQRGPIRKEILTAEIIYYWMVALQIDFQTEHWHLNRLITLVKVCNEKNKPAPKGRTRTNAAQRAALNRQRRTQHGTTG